jgi:hypothetical protein
MAVAVQDRSITDVDHVLAAVVAAYMGHREPVDEVLLAELVTEAGAVGAVRAVVAPSVRCVEVALDDGLDPDALIPPAWEIAGRGWTLVVLTPLERLGDAHTALRGVPCVLQGWWSADDAVAFSAHETP